MFLSPKAKRELFFISLILFGLISGYFLIWGESGYLAVRAQQQDLERLTRENIQLKKQLNEYWEKIERVRNDPAELERLLREHNYARPNEVIVTIPD